MIVIKMVFPKNNRFKSWFYSADDFGSQKVRGLLYCPNCGDVGKQFSVEARCIHCEEAPQRAIRGVASGEEIKELIEEGIPVLPLSIPDRGD